MDLILALLPLFESARTEGILGRRGLGKEFGGKNVCVRCKHFLS